VDFTSIKSSVVIEITLGVKRVHVFWIDFIFKIDVTIIVGIISINEINRDGEDIITRPSSFTSVFFNNFKWTITIEFWISGWTIVSSPIVFNDKDTLVGFTHINITVTVEVTVVH